jgi:hypothetical protein
MATSLRPFDYGKKDYIDRLNDLYTQGMTRVRTSALDPDAPGTDVTASRQMRLGDNGCCADVRASNVVFTLHAECLVDGFSFVINVVTGSASVNVAGIGFFTDSGGTPTSKSISVGNAAIISSDGIGFRIFRMTAV